MKRRICVATGSRAEYGLLRPVISKIDAADDLELQLVVTGMHLAAEFGYTYREIEADGFSIDFKVDSLLGSDTSVALAKSMGLGLIGFGDALQQLQPHWLLVLGDRFEILPAVVAALVAKVPVAHLHGGETTEGAFDESIRHAITKMSHLHFVAMDEYKGRVVQLGEHPDRVHMVGGLGVDNIQQLDLLDRQSLESAIDFKLGNKNLLVTFHPATLEAEDPSEQMRQLLAALDTLDDVHLIFTMPNADSGGRELIDLVSEFAARHTNARAYKSLGQLRYLSCLKFVDGVVGNSSSGLAEAPSFKIGTVNIGDRQRGRAKAASVIDCAADRKSVIGAIDKLYSPSFQSSLEDVKNPYGDGGAAKKIVDVLKRYPADSLLQKPFFDIAQIQEAE